MAGKKRWVFFFSDLDPHEVSEAVQLLGGKGAGLAAMTAAGLNVPPGFTISTECCRYYFENNGKWPDGLEDQVRENLARLEHVMGRTFGRGKRPLLLSVRSGAARSMPGMMDTVLNCGMHPGLADEVGDTLEFWRRYIQFIDMFAKEYDLGATEEEQPSRELAAEYLMRYKEKTGRVFPTDPWEILVACINAVFRSWNSERAVAYRRRNRIHGLLGTAVTVQAMFPSRVSGILFTRNPNDPSAEEMVIESSYGLGEVVVSGDVMPDRFVVKRDDLGKVQTFVGKKSRMVRALDDNDTHETGVASLRPEQIAELCELAMRVEARFGHPVDMEWGWADGVFAVLQSRPIRGLEVTADVEAGRTEEVARLRSLAGNRRRVWVVHNLGETLRAPTPLTWDIVRRFMSGSGGFGRMYQDFGYRPSDTVGRDGFLELIAGRIYADPDRVAQLFWGDVPMTYDLDAILRDKSQLDRAPTRLDADRVDGRFIFRLPAMFRAMIRSARIMKGARKTARSEFENGVLPPYLKYIQQKRNQELATLSAGELIVELHERCGRVLDEFGKESLKPGFFGALAFSTVERLLVQLMGKEDGARLAHRLSMGLEGDVTFEQDALLCRVAADEASLGAFMERFGHRAAGEMELAVPRWREDPTYVEQIVRAIRAAGGRSAEAIHDENVRKRKAAEEELPRTLALWGGSSWREEIEAQLRDARDLLPFRETGKHYLMMGYELIRLVLCELAHRWDLGEDLFFLQWGELERFESDRVQLGRAIAKRKIRWQAFQRLDMLDSIDSTDLERLGLAQEWEATGELKGEALAAGIATGPARIVFDPAEAGDLGVDYILVCPSTDPGWTPLFINARGLIVEQGGMLSHGAIVARDFGIPAVVCPEATKRIRTGDRIRLDGNRGRITITGGEGTAAGAH